MKPEDELRERAAAEEPEPWAEPELPEVGDELQPAVDWIQERGGSAQVAEDFLKMTAGEHSYAMIGPALEKAGAPSGVYALINGHLWARRKR